MKEFRRFLPANRDRDTSNARSSSPRKRNRLFMSSSKHPQHMEVMAKICRVFSRDSDDNTGSFHTAVPDISWDESSSSNGTFPPSCLKVLTLEDSLKYSYYSGTGFGNLPYRVDFSTQTVYFHDLTVQELRRPNNKKETQIKPHSIAIQPDPWKVEVSSVPVASACVSRKKNERQIQRWSRATREDLWQQFCLESSLEKQQRLYIELQLAEKELSDIMAVKGDTDHFEEQARHIQKTLDAMEDIW
eukprot:scaffold2193_cov171-Amphora_coffeaeformis.AAC.13